MRHCPVSAVPGSRNHAGKLEPQRPEGGGGSSIKEPGNAGAAGDGGSIPGLGRSPGEGHDNPLQYSRLKNPTEESSGPQTIVSQSSRKDWTNLARKHTRHVRGGAGSLSGQRGGASGVGSARAGPEVPSGGRLAVCVLCRFSMVGGAVLAGSRDATSPCGILRHRR